MNWRPWLYSIIAGAIGGASSSILGVLAMPDVFNFTHDGWVHIGKLAFIGGATPVFYYLKQSPLPPMVQTVTTATTLSETTTTGPVPQSPEPK